MQMVRGENDEPDVHIGFDEEQKTEEIEDEGILSDDTRRDDSWWIYGVQYNHNFKYIM